MLKKLTKVLSLLLILCLMVSMFPAVALADEGTEAPVVTETPEETTPVVTPVPEESSAPVESPVPEESSAPVESPVPSETPAVEASPAPSDTPVDNTSAAGDEPALDEPGDYSLTNPNEGVAATSLTMGTKPADGTTTGNPFDKGTGGSNSFRIPALVTLSNGTLVAAADARWNTTYDGGGLDTIVSYSSDNGANWNYTFANYLGDNGNTYNGSGSTAFIDPALATDGSTVYMLCDLYPYGVALNGSRTNGKSDNTAPSTAVGFNSDGKLLLSTDGSNYNYYLDGTVIKDSIGNEVSGLTVDSYFNVTGTYNNTAYNTNLFFSDSPFKVVRTGYLYLTKSTDGGKNWSEPTLIPNVKTSSEQVCLVGPGRGLVTSSGMIVFPVYSFHGDNEPSGNTQRLSFIYSTDSGSTWKRTAELNYNWASEAAVVELADGTLRFFFRNGTKHLCYVDYANNTWGTPVEETSISTNSNTQISAISYSKTVGGQQVILVSCPTGSNSNGSTDSSASARLNGKIFVGYVNSDNTMSWQSDKAIFVTSNNSQFMYSCLTELSDGKVAILYENQESAWGTGSNCYYTMDFQTYDLGLTFDSGNSGEGEGEENNDPVTVTDNNSSVSATAKGLTKVLAEKQNAASPYTGYTAAVTYSITLNDGAYTDSAAIKIPYDSAFDGCNNFIGSVLNADDTISTFSVDLKDGFFVGTAPHFSDVTISGRTVTQEENVTLVVDEISKNYTEAGNYSNNYTAPNASIATIEITGQDAQEGGVEYKQASVTCNDLISSDSNSWTAASEYYYTPDGTNYYPVYAKRSSASKGALWWQYTQYTYTWGYKIGDSEPTQIGDTQIEGSSSADGRNETPDITVYTQSSTAAIPASTTFSFTGVSAGTTIAVVGSTQYNITVNRKTETVALTVGNTVTYPDTNAGSVTVADGTVAEASLTNGQLTIKGLKEGTTTVTTNSTVYTVNVTAATPLSVRQGESTQISVTLDNGQYVKWSTADSSYVGVAGQYNTSTLTYTNMADVFGQQVTSSGVEVTGTVYDADGNVVSVSKWLVTVTEAASNTASVTRYYNVDQAENCTMYYSINGGELVQVNGSGVSFAPESGVDNSYVIINGTWYGDLSLMFFAAPNEGYALTHLFVEDSANQYYVLSDGIDSNGNEDVTKSSAWPFLDNVNPEAVYTANGHTYSIEEIASLYKAGKTTIYETVKADSNIWKTVKNALHGYRWALLEGYVTSARLQELYEDARALGCTGVTTITRASTNTSGSGSASDPISVCAVAQKLATLNKEVTSIVDENNKDVTANGIVKIGYTVSYKVTVTVPATPAKAKYWNGSSIATAQSNNTDIVSSISYSSMTVTDSLINYASGFNWTQTSATSSTTNGDDQTYSDEYTVTLTKENFGSVVTGGTISNTAALTYDFTASYGTGSHRSSVQKVVDVTVEIPNYVVDFGLPVEINLSDSTSGDGGIISVTDGTYGTAEVNSKGTGFIYTPNKILQGIDYVDFTYRLNGDSTDYTYRVAIYPATTVYYEEGFAELSNSVNTPGWTEGSKGTGSQTAEVAGSKSNNYGYDGKYANEVTGPSNGSAAVSSTIADAATFSFTGTGVDIYANCTPGSGAVNVVIRDSNNALVKLLIIDTKTDTGSSEATAGQKVDSYSLPIASVTGLAHGTYTVTVRHSKLTAEDNGKPVSLDGFRVYGTLADQNNSVYVNDLEDNPTYIELRNEVLKALNVTTISNSQYANQVASDIMKQVYDGTDTSEDVETGTQALVLSGNATLNAQDLLDNGPKNEIFLRNGDSLVFTVTTDREVQIGLKAVNNTVTCTVNNVAKTITSSTDMFYTVFNKGDATNGQTITIKNTGGGILSITKLKICDDPGATLGELTEEDLIPALVGMGYEPEPEEPVVEYADATLTVVVNDAATTLTQNGVKGETATFTAEDIEAAAQSLVLEGYELKGQAETVTVVYGESDTVTFSAEEIPTEPEEPEEPEQPTEPEEPEQPSKPENIISAVIRLFDKIFGSLKGLFR